jgi:hypothetical protein
MFTPIYYTELGLDLKHDLFTTKCIMGSRNHSAQLIFSVYQGKLNHISVFPFLDLVAGLFTFFFHAFHIIQVRKWPMGRTALV